jgi:hypothetical protein
MEVGSNTYTVALQIVRGDEMVTRHLDIQLQVYGAPDCQSLEFAAVKYCHDWLGLTKDCAGEGQQQL